MDYLISSDGRYRDGWRYYFKHGKLPQSLCKRITELLKKLNSIWKSENLYGKYTISETNDYFVLSHYFLLSLDDNMPEYYEGPRCVQYFLRKDNLEIGDIKLNFSLEEDHVASSDKGVFSKNLLQKMSKYFVGIFTEIDNLSKLIKVPIDYLEVCLFDILFEVNEREYGYARLSTSDADSYKEPSDIYLCTTPMCKETGSWEDGVLGKNAVCIAL